MKDYTRVCIRLGANGVPTEQRYSQDKEQILVTGSTPTMDLGESYQQKPRSRPLRRKVAVQANVLPGKIMGWPVATYGK